MSQEKLVRILSSVAQKMRAEFRQSSVFEHNGEAGTSREVTVHDFLRSYLPGHVKAVRNAEIVSASGEVSSQCDIVIINRGTPPLTTLEGYQVIPNESVYGVVEVKTTLNGNQLVDACEKVRRARSLEKSAYRRIRSPIERKITAYGATFSHFPTCGIVVAFDSINLETLGDHLWNWCSSRPVYDWPDSVWVLGKGYFQWWDEQSKKITRTPVPGSKLIRIDASEDDILLPLLLHLNMHFSEAWMDPLDLVPYAGSETLLGKITQEWPSG
ncbi:hypothetical protein H181DRAFT_02031 [Streptomyces sp. WMMB 714]|jgi:hypothetical protein|uniref:DUF6602 domain-containing protein n=1 Tax=Streptomyces sp. WMMB 714 TaxID=1286822 RepID=UPI000823C914|nr:DUF6602 domain-containing protein [Streptomyces sp. WMMB 714]SCK25967.1 hypothetical protein H181DRAFT_02031 [Streptomyces sp. WMMB 714]